MERIIIFFFSFLLVNTASHAQEVYCKSGRTDKIEGRIVSSDTNSIFFVPLEKHILKNGQCAELMRMNSLTTRNGGNWSWGNSLGNVEVLKQDGAGYLLKQMSTGDDSGVLTLFAALLKMDLNTTFEIQLFDWTPCEIKTEYWPDTEIPESRGCTCEWERKGRWLEYTELGQLKEIKNYNDGDLMGEYVQFNAAGDTVIIGAYEDDKKSGTWTAYYPGMKKKQVATFEDGKIIGIVLDYFENGVQEKSTSYNAYGKQEGPVTLWYPSGKLKEEYSVDRNAVRTGVSKTYYPSGQLEMEVSYKSDMYSGPMKRYYENAQLKESGEYVSGEKNGVWNSYSESGVLLTSYGFFSDDKHGVYSENFPNGQLFKKGELFDGKETGEFEEYYENGNLKIKGVYSFGSKTGIWLENYEDGSPKSTGLYLNDARSGKWSEWDANGKRRKIKY